MVEIRDEEIERLDGLIAGEPMDLEPSRLVERVEAVISDTCLFQFIECSLSEDLGCARTLALRRGEDVDASEYTFRTSTQIETASRDLDWLNKGVFISVGGRRQGAVIYETYLVA